MELGLFVSKDGLLAGYGVLKSVGYPYRLVDPSAPNRAPSDCAYRICLLHFL